MSNFFQWCLNLIVLPSRRKNQMKEKEIKKEETKSYGDLLNENITRSQREDVLKLKNMIHGKADCVFNQILNGASDVSIKFNYDDSLFLYKNHINDERLVSMVPSYLLYIWREELETPLNKNGLKLNKPRIRWRGEIGDGFVFRVEPEE